MGLVASDSKYYKINKVVGFNDDERMITVEIEGYRDLDTRNNMTPFDSKTVDHFIVNVDDSDIETFVAKLYEKVKLLDKFKDMTDA